MFILFRCSAGGNHGWGNIKRLELIYRSLKRNHSFKYKFIINSNSEVEEYLSSKKIDFISLNKNNEDKILKKINSVDLSILELLYCSLKIQKKYKKISKRLIILDDITKRHYISDVLISCQKKYFEIKKDDQCKYYNDYSYFPLPSNYDKYINKKKKINKEIRIVSVFIGGSNYIKDYIGIAKVLSKTSYQVIFLIGPENSVKITKKIKEISKNFEVQINTDNIPKYLFNSDVVISGGGYTKIETAYLKTPVLCIPIHKHQKELIKDFYSTFKIDKKLQKYSNKNDIISSLKYLDFKKRLQMSNIFSKIFKKNGVSKILNIINERT